MSPNLEQEIFDRWPQWFTHKDDRTKSATGIGFTFGDGWRQIILNLLTEIEPMVAESTCGEPFEIEQVKEKFGDFRFYTNWTTPTIDAAIEAAREKSQRTCELCGAEGSRSFGICGYAIRCESCFYIELGPKVIQSGQAFVGIFWYFRSRLILRPTKLNKAERWGDFLNATSHESVWTRIQELHWSAKRVQYDTPPRGRVVFDLVHKRFYIYADQCIVDVPELIAEIIRRLNLPPDTPAISDSHYCCSTCMQRGGDERH